MENFEEFLELYSKSGKTNPVFIPEETAGDFAEEKEKEGFGILFVI